MQIRFAASLDEVEASHWNRLAGTDNPFVRHEFLHTLEVSGSVGGHSGWHPHHLLIEHQGELLAAAPLYLKAHSWGEFVFDWSWAEAYERHGLAYYPKLVAASPFSPVTGARLLCGDVERGPELRALAARAIRDEARRLGLSSAHGLFPEESELSSWEAQGFRHRLGVQYHWHNRDYRDFEDFLAALSSRKRKNIRRERRGIEHSGIEFQRLRGTAIKASHWRAMERFYRSTFMSRGNPAPLRPGFFAALGERMPEAALLILACRDGEPVAGAFCLQGADTLYGRYWGCDEEISGLHFETCYYQGIDYCIEQGLQRFEPGAQGEHKVPRGFLPQATHSAHWIAEPAFAAAIEDFLQREQAMVREYMSGLLERHNPYRNSGDTEAPG
ncbi:GNAT family N-acetyltransferase [Alkalilimnicola sp. S0819]|uniref:GNAT family N-acetyltransferase n=1 Tax=Alkalilimnicola sp. S0819 TaxID=2613922 RepID=UPI001261AD09|nr:GNAT family N-acetyltransferase [Alkalilimnicola sp. S0819]KAB7627517.1 N-acetyltransferase [Alkalilimnicola sp. S0819]MPQ15671.1 GNAT family N-acetyltransferase [Alkalilimnicola sp. S0819]